MLNLCGGRKCPPCKKFLGKLANHSYWSREEWLGLVQKQWQLRMKTRDISETSGQKHSIRCENIQKSTNFFLLFSFPVVQGFGMALK
jgi:hypothetical protein